MMSKLSFHSSADVQLTLARYLRQKRQMAKWSRQDLAQRSTVPASTIKKFETTGKIALHQFLLLWQSLDDLSRLQALAHSPPVPQTIDDVLRQ